MFTWSNSAWKQGSQAGGRRCYLLGSVKKRWEIMHRELIQLTLGKWLWHAGSCRTWPFNLSKVWIKINCPSETHGDDLHVGPWGILWSVKKSIVFFESMACIWKLHPAIVDFTFYSVSSAFHYWQLLGVRWHIMKLCIELQGLYFPLLSQNEKISHCAEISHTVHCRTVDVENTTPEKRTAPGNSCTCNAKGCTKCRNPTG